MVRIRCVHLVEQILELNTTLLYNLKNEPIPQSKTGRKSSGLKDLFLKTSPRTLQKDPSHEVCEKKSVAECFKKVSPYLKMYTSYVNSYEHACSFILDLQNSNQNF